MLLLAELIIKHASEKLLFMNEWKLLTCGMLNSKASKLAWISTFSLVYQFTLSLAILAREFAETLAVSLPKFSQNLALLAVQAKMSIHLHCPRFIHKSLYTHLWLFFGHKLVSFIVFYMHSCINISGYSNYQVLLSGCSAGGLATFLHCDDLALRLHKATTVKCMSDAGFFLDV